MDSIRLLERYIHRCPETRSSDHQTFPPAEPELYSTMVQMLADHASSVVILPFVRRNAKGLIFVDIYVWDVPFYSQFCSDSYERFVICEGYRLPEALEKRFFSLQNQNAVVPEELMDQLNVKIPEHFPQWHYPGYSVHDFRPALEHIYFASHRSGAKEILYKSGLVNIAFILDCIPSVNYIGSTPEQIIGNDLPLKLLRILNQPQLIEKFYSEEQIEVCREVYHAYSGYIGDALPTAAQWAYLEELSFNGGVFAGHSFLRTMYDLLSQYGRTSVFDQYKRLLSLQDLYPEIAKLGFPKPDEMTSVLNKLEQYHRYMQEQPDIDRLIRDRKNRARYEYEGDTYRVTLPATLFDICYEAIIQGNCLMQEPYAENHAYDNATLLFLRRRNEPDQPFITLELSGRQIVQAYGRFNSIPCKEIYVFLMEFAKKEWLLCDPYELVFHGLDVDEPGACDDSVLDFAEEYRHRTTIPKFPEIDPGTFTQLSIDDCEKPH
ncbi:MAG: PcfJ domain-containing protein [Lachnospiraceae bacterium]|nr:PcfJ domain-containing protein [Lachnospiraceae bacterium]